MRRRTNERGAAIFIVVMVMTMLSAIGVFAVRASSQLEMAAGFDRKASQALYVSEFGLRMLIADFVGKEDDYNRQIAGGSGTCVAAEKLEGHVPAGFTVPCFALDQLELKGRAQAYLPSPKWVTDADGFFGRVMRPGQETSGEAAFRIEITDLGPAPKAKAGTDLSGQNFKHRQVTMTAMGQVRPVPPGSTCDAATVQASSVQAVRSHVTFMSSN